MVNDVTLIGNLGQDPEVKPYEGGAITKFSLATSESFKNKEGEKVSKTQWHRIVVFGKAGEIIGKYCKQGDRLYVRGSIEYGKYDNSEGVTVYTTDIKVRDFKFLTSKGDGQAKDAPPAPVSLDHDDDLPF